MNNEDIANLISAYELAISEAPNIDMSNIYPVYPEAISNFMRILQSAPWVANDYQPSKIQEILMSIESGSFKEVRWVLTAAARSERFGDGMWAKIFNEKMLDPVIKRLKQLSNA